MFLQGPNLQLIAYGPENWQVLARWLYSDECRAIFRHRPKALNKDEITNYQRTVGAEVFLIEHRKDQKFIGFCEILPDSKTNRAFYSGILLDPEYRGNRYPFEAFLILFNYAFNSLGYRKSIQEILESNTSLKRTLDENGFIYEGKLFGDAFIDGKFVNELRYCMFDSYFNKTYKPLLDEYKKSVLP